MHVQCDAHVQLSVVAQSSYCRVLKRAHVFGDGSVFGSSCAPSHVGSRSIVGECDPEMAGGRSCLYVSCMVCVLVRAQASLS